MSTRMMKISAYLMVLAVFTVGTWLLFSGIVSFVKLEWASATETSLGRGLFAGVVVWMGFRLLGDE